MKEEKTREAKTSEVNVPFNDWEMPTVVFPKQSKTVTQRFRKTFRLPRKTRGTRWADCSSLKGGRELGWTREEMESERA